MINDKIKLLANCKWSSFTSEQNFCTMQFSCFSYVALASETDVVLNSPLPSCCLPWFQSESWCTTIQNGNERCIFMQIKPIIIRMV